VSDGTRTRLLALIGVSDGQGRAAPAGAEPLDAAKTLPAADVILLVADGGPDAMLFRYTAFGEIGGDSWHLTVADAQEQASEEYGDALLPWEEVPDEVADAHAHAVGCASERLNDRGKW
jgi:hypothetical protein